jgi:hypothetical protein
VDVTAPPALNEPAGVPARKNRRPDDRHTRGKLVDRPHGGDDPVTTQGDAPPSERSPNAAAVVQARDGDRAPGDDP